MWFERFIMKSIAEFYLLVLGLLMWVMGSLLSIQVKCELDLNNNTSNNNSYPNLSRFMIQSYYTTFITNYVDL